MKLVTFIPAAATPAAPRLGALLPGDHAIADLQQGFIVMTGAPAPFLDDMLSLLDGGEPALEHAHRILEFSASQRPPDTLYSPDRITLLAPVPRPRSIRDCIAFEQHLVQATRAVVRRRLKPLAVVDGWIEKLRGRALIGVPAVWRERPLYYKGNPFSVIGPEADVHWPPYTEQLDYELELGVFIGRRGRDIPKRQAKGYIAGYTIFNDFSARDIQLREMQGRLGPAKGKDFDTGNALGPYLVTADEIPDPYALTLTARVNGEEWSRGGSAAMHFTFEDIIAYISQAETLYPGEFIGSGTVGGGCGLELDRWLQPGDSVALEVTGLGVLRNRIVKPPSEPPAPQP